MYGWMVTAVTDLEDFSVLGRGGGVGGFPVVDCCEHLASKRKGVYRVFKGLLDCNHGVS